MVKRSLSSVPTAGYGLHNVRRNRDWLPQKFTEVSIMLYASFAALNMVRWKGYYMSTLEHRLAKGEAEQWNVPTVSMQLPLYLKTLLRRKKRSLRQRLS